MSVPKNVDGRRASHVASVLSSVSGAKSTARPLVSWCRGEGAPRHRGNAASREELTAGKDSRRNKVPRVPGGVRPKAQGVLQV